MPALEMTEDTRTLVSWRKKERETVIKGEIVLKIETDKVVVELEALADGVPAGVKAQPSDVIPVVRRPPELVQTRARRRSQEVHVGER
jgi:pyruvate dehydrogenase E2 component (dihydrolipoyllysine-residue acetyltransferase)